MPIATARFSKRDFYEEADGTIRLTRPLSSHLAMTAAIWRPAAQAVAGWLARALAGSLGAERRVPVPLPALPAPKRTWQGLEPPVAKTCHECGKALAARQRKFCSEACAISFHVATTTAAEVTALPAPGAAGAADGAASDRGGGSKNRKHLAMRRAWDAEHASARQPRARRNRNSFTAAIGPAVDELREWFSAEVAPQMRACTIGEIRRVTGLSTRYAIMIRQGHAPHPRHFPTLAGLVGVKPPSQR